MRNKDKAFASQSELFPYRAPFHRDRLPLNGLHSVYFEEYGAPMGTPLLLLHGGPGAAILGHRLEHVRQFDLDYYRVIYPHQRGSGYSTPRGETRENTTWDLIEDLENLRQRLAVDRWIVSGGSWGSTLALAYAQSYPERCIGLFLRGIFLGRAGDLSWFFSAGKAVFPDAWDEFVGHLPTQERGDFFAAYSRRILSGDPRISIRSCKAWAKFELSCFKFFPDPDVVRAGEREEFCVPYARLNIHYFSNSCFLSDRPILENVDRLSGVPVYIVHGRYDLSVPLRQARDLSLALPRSELIVVPDAGHSAMDPSNAAAALHVQEKMKQWK